MKTIALFFLLFARAGFAQQIELIVKTIANPTRDLYILRPPADSIRGLLVLNSRTLSDSAKLKAYRQGIMTLTVLPSDNFMDNLCSHAILVTIDSIVKQVVTKYKINHHNVIIGGMSVAGTGAVRYAAYCYAAKATTPIRPVAVFAVDPPLDYERLWNEAKRSVERNFSKPAIEESLLLMTILKKACGGSPQLHIQSYQQLSPFCYTARGGGNAYLLNQVAIRLYTEPDVNWWIDNRRKDYYDLNSIDNAALINQLKLNGNTRASLITTSNRGFTDEGRHPHAWSIIDEMELLDWCNTLFTK